MDVIKERLLDIKHKHLKEDGYDEECGDSDIENYNNQIREEK